MAAIFSALKEVFKGIGKKGGIKGAYIGPTLRGKGVKEDEIKWADLDIDPDKYYAKEELLELEKGRKDVHGVKESKEYSNISIASPEQGHTYKARVYTFKQKQARPKITKEEVEELAESEKPLVESRYNAPHFSETDNYLMHARSFDDTLDTTPTRVLQEIQSDLHQKGRRFGYKGEKSKASTITVEQEEALAKLHQLIDVGIEDDEIFDVAFDAGMRPDDGDIEDWAVARLEALDRGEIVVEGAEGAGAPVGAPAVSPFERTWARKTIEKELVQAVNDGRQQLAVPISGKEVDEKLSRGEGVKEWYEKVIIPQMRKIARASGSDFEIKEVSSRTAQPLLKDPNQVRTLHADLLNIVKIKAPIRRKATINAVKQSSIFKDNKKAQEILNDFEVGIIDANKALDNLISLTERPTTKYAIIKPNPAKTKDLKFTLYSSPAAAAMAAYQVKNAEEEMRKAGKDEGFIKDTMEKVNGIEKLIKAGVSMEEIKAHLEKTNANQI